jgi:hypothetical protein
MPEQIIGRRNESEDEWHWGVEQFPAPQRSANVRLSVRRLALIALGLALIGSAVALFVLFEDRSGSQSSVPGSSTDTTSPPVDANGATTAAAASSVPPSHSPGIGADFRYYIWSREDSQWRDSDNTRDGVGYSEGEAVPFLVVIENTMPAAVYQVSLEYQCRTSEGAAFDYLSSISDADNASESTAPAPARREDASMLIPDDPSITFDSTGRRFQVWGGSFDRIAVGPSPSDQCENRKSVGLSLLAQGETLFLLWGGHLASSSDWGDNQGASSQQSPLSISASVNDSEAETLAIGEDAIRP